jgi:hypothetical protein
MTIDEIIERMKVPILKGSMIINNIILVLIYFGIVGINVAFVKHFNTFLQLAISLFLIYRFNPISKHELRKNDSSIIFGCAILLLTNLGITQYFMKNAEKIVTTEVSNGINMIEHGLDELWM